MTLYNISKIKFFLIFLFITTFFIQLFLIDTNKDLLCLIIVFSINILTTYYCLNKNTYFDSPLTYLIILFSSFYNLGFSILFKTLEFRSLTNNLEYSLEICIFIGLFNIFIIFLHSIYLKIVPNTFLFKKIKKKILSLEIYGYNKKNFILFSLIAIPLNIYFFNIKIDSANFEDQPLLLDVWNGLNFLVLSPVVVYYYQQKKSFISLILIILIYLIMSFGLNAMTALYDVLLLIFIILYYDFTIEKIKPSKNKNFILVIVLILTPYTFNFVNNFTYMYYQARETNEGKNFQARANTFLDGLKNYGEYNKLYKAERKNSDIIFKENYYEKYIFLNRINPVKIHDNFIIIKKSTNKVEQENIKKYEINKIISILPQPIIKLFDKNFNKINYKFSTASYSYKFIDPKLENPSFIGSFAMSLYIYFNYFSFVFLIPFAFLIFFISDVFTNKMNKLSPIIIFLLFSTPGGLVNSFAFSEISKILYFLLREIPQLLLFMYILSKIFNWKNKIN